MEEQDIPIDINNNKLLDWLISRRHVSKDWQKSILPIREKINNAIQDMPAHEEIIKLLTGQHINYFHCLKIIEILKETEADTKNLFGSYGSQRMKDWQNVVSLYQKENVYLAEAAQLLIRNVSYEVPSLKKQIAKVEQSVVDAEKKIKDCVKNEAQTLKEFRQACDQLGIKGRSIKSELLEKVHELGSIYEKMADKMKIVKPAVELYLEFNAFLSGRNATECSDVMPLVRFVLDNGNTTTYHYVHGEKPQKIEVEQVVTQEKEPTEPDADQIDFGDSEEVAIDWGSTPSTDSDFEIVELEESGIVVEKLEGVARGDEALSLLDNPKTRDQITNELMELEAFLKMRSFELSADSDILAMSQMQNASAALQMQTVESIMTMTECVNVVVGEMLNKRVLHLHNVKHSNKYVDILSADLGQKLVVAERLKQRKVLLEEQVEKWRTELRNLEVVVRSLLQKTQELQQNVQIDISKKYKGRVVNIVGGVNMLY